MDTKNGERTKDISSKEIQLFVEQQKSDQKQFPIFNKRLGFSTSDASENH